VWTQVPPGLLSPRRRAWDRFSLGWARLVGARLPVPEHAPLSETSAIARWLAAELRRGTRPCLTTYASSAVRVCLAAQRDGLDLAGAVFVTIGEPLTPAKRAAIERTGARIVVRYAVTEAGILGYGCADPQACDDVHALTDSVAVIRHPRPVGDDGVTVPGLLVTSLLPQSPKLLLNVETGDHAELSHRACGCALGRAGLETHLAGIRSFEKLTGEGMTFAGTGVLRILEEVLPARFGGRPSDYQLLEVEDAGGITHLELRADPSIGPLDESRVREAFLAALEDDRRARPMTEIWKQAQIVRLRRSPPVATRMGKILPSHLVKRQEDSGGGEP
jgi:phenylacetate-coenzyme A ligase PaaK-like adenylate-forming protein